MEECKRSPWGRERPYSEKEDKSNMGPQWRKTGDPWVHEMEGGLKLRRKTENSEA
jgi:hypothetical protein